jgi:16S rRNA C967 or C1407 C5-methylase (RsmB/RsmF family)/NOL1/NOP2/fmu family ribosome biogenesis protein
MVELPAAFIETMKEKLGQEFGPFVNVLKKPSPTSLRINPKKQSQQEDADSIPWTDFGKYLKERPVFTLDPHLHAGSYYVQEASSMFLEQAIKQTVDLKQSMNVLDLCAAPGGKSTHILSLINDTSLLVSNEVIRSRSTILSENIQKWGYPNAVVTNNDPENFQRLQGFFDLIVVDAPCSGEGLFRKDPEAMKEWTPDNVQLCAARQKRIVSDVWPALKSEGIFIYCTCTYNEFENEQNLEWLQNEKSVEFLALKTESGWNIEEVRKRNIIGYRFYPHRLAGEGFFISVCRKTENVNEKRVNGKNKLASTSKKTVERISNWINEIQNFKSFDHENVTHIFPENKFSILELISQNLKIVHAGTKVCEVKHDKLIPEHALALSIHINKNDFKNIELNYEDAIRYLRRDAFTIDDATKGYCLLTFENSPLGFINHLGNRFNNMYPIDWRIRMNPV